MPRQLDNWLYRFLQWTKPVSESPESFLYMTGLFTLACAVRKHVKIPRKGLLGGWDCFPNIYTVIVGEPGIARKSSTMDFGESLLLKIPNVPAAPTEISQAALMSALTESPDGSLYIAATELEELVRKTSKEMFGFLTSGFDVRRPIKSRTLKRGVEIVENPCINMFACTTPGWIKENMPASVITGGFSSRTLFVYEEEPRKLEIFYDEVDYEELAKIEPKLIEDLIHISDITGDFKFESQDLLENIRYWYKVDLQKQMKEADPRIKPYYARKHVQMFKIAMLIHLAYSDELVLKQEDIEASLSLLDGLEKNMLKVFGYIGKNIYNQDIDSLREYLKIKKKAPRAELTTVFQASAEPDKLLGLLKFLVIQGEVREGVDKNDIYYEYIGPMVK
jgi:hypothetical protein